MASIKCAVCGCGIHYHDEPNMTEYILFPTKFWKNLRNYYSNAEPVLYKLKADALELEHQDVYYKLWLCPKCKTAIVFEKHSPNVDKILVEMKDSDSLETGSIEYIAFSDCTWDAITEGNTNIDELPSKFPGEYYISSFNGRYYIYSDEMCKNLISTYAFDEVLTHRIKSEEL